MEGRSPIGSMGTIVVYLYLHVTKKSTIHVGNIPYMDPIGTDLQHSFSRQNLASRKCVHRNRNYSPRRIGEGRDVVAGLLKRWALS